MYAITRFQRLVLSSTVLHEEMKSHTEDISKRVWDIYTDHVV